MRSRRRAFVFVADFSLMHVARCDTGVIVLVVREQRGECSLLKGSQSEVRGRRQCLCAYCLFVKHPSTRHIGTLAPRPRPPPPSDEASSVLSGKKYMREGRRWATPYAPRCMDDK